MTHFGAVVAFAATAIAACQAVPQTSLTLDAARAELATLISDVPGATRSWYDVSDDFGREMGPMKIVWVPEANAFAASYFTDNAGDLNYHANIATSADLEHWTWRVELATRASQPAIAAGPDGTYLVAWEQEPDPIYNVLEEFGSWDALLADQPSRHFDVPITTLACGEGTPSFESITADRVQLGFHYHGGCDRDRQAFGWTDWSTWHSELRPELDRALISQGVDGHIGDRDTVTYRGHEFMLLEGERVLDDWSTWQMFLYDAETTSAIPLEVRTVAGSVSFSNPSLALVDINGHPSLLVSLYIFTEGSRAGEDGTLIYYREL